MKQKRKHGKKLLSFLLTLMVVVGLMPMSVFATEWSGNVEAPQLQAGNVLTSDVKNVREIDEYTLTLASGGHGSDFMGVKNSDTVINGPRFRNRDGILMVKDDIGEDYVPYNENGMVDYWVVAAVDHSKRTITLTGKGGAGDGDPVALGSQVDYVYYNTADSSMHNGTTPNSAYKVDNGNVKWANGSWYVLTENVTFDKRIKIDGTVNLVLCDGATLTANKGIEVNAGATLNIYAQSGGTGAINVDMPESSTQAAIGSGAKQATGTITIHGGNINAVSGYGAAIGGGERGDTGVISIYGGTVYARNKGYGAGIGCGYGGNYINYTAEINILGGTVTGWCSTWPQGDGIGKSNYDGSAPGTINIRDGAKVYAGENAESAALTTASEYLSNRTHYVRIEADIEKKDQTVTAPTAQTGLVYDGTQRTLLQSGASVTAGNLEAEVMYQYAGDDSWYTFEDLPKKADAGTYTVNYKVDGNDSFKEFTGSIEVTISPAEAKITAGDQAIKEGEAVATGTDQVTVEGLQEGQMLDEVSVSAGTGDDADKVIASGATILDANGADVTANYNITYVPGSLKVHKKISATVTFKVQNGSWDEGEGDEAKADRTVILSGYEGDTLTLTEDQIPAVGNKPDDTYKAGSWDVTPGTDTVITEDTTYTYIYKQGDIDTYTLTIPSSLKVKNTGWNATDGISASGTLGSGKKLTVTAASANGWALKSDEASVGYTLTTEENGSQTETWEFTALDGAKQGLGIMVEDYSGKPAGEYKDTVTFTAKVERSAVS